MLHAAPSKLRALLDLITGVLWQTAAVRVALQWFVCAWLCALPAFAQPRIDWQASSGCPSADDGLAQIEQLLDTPLAKVAITLSATVRLRRDPRSGFVATIEVHQAELARSRSLYSDDCAVLAHAAAVVVALAIDPAASGGATSARSSPETGTAPSRARAATPEGEVGSANPRAGPVTTTATRETTAAGATKPAATVRSEAAAETRTQPAENSSLQVEGGNATAAHSGGHASATLRPVFGAGAALSVGTLPKLGPAIALSGGVETTWIRAALRLSYAPSQRAELDTPAGAGGGVGLSAAAIEAALRQRASLFELSWLCGFEAGVFDAHGGGGGSTGETRHPLWLGGYLGGGVALAMSASFAVGLRLEGVVALRRPSFVLQSDLGDEYQVHRPGLLAGRGWLELELHFPD